MHVCGDQRSGHAGVEQGAKPVPLENLQAHDEVGASLGAVQRARGGAQRRVRASKVT